MPGFSININSAIAAGAAAVLAATGAALVALIAPQTGLAQAIAGPAPLAEPRAAAAEAALSAGDLARAQAQTWAELRVAPVREAAWVRLARIDFARHHAFTAMGLEALSHSFDAAPYDLAPRSERAAFMRAHWAALSPALRAAGADEARVRADQASAPAHDTEL